MSSTLHDVIGSDALGALRLAVGSGGLLGVAHIYLRHRTRIQLERERSRRIRFRALVLARTVAMMRPGTRVLDHDMDNHLFLIDYSRIFEATSPRSVGEAE